MSPTPDSSTEDEPTSPETVQELKEILIKNGIHDTVSEVIVKDSGLRGENMASKTNRITITFENLNKKPLELFMKSALSSNLMMLALDGAKFFEKEARFFMEYLPAVRELCKSLGQEKLMEIYPKCYFGDNKKLIFENLVLDRGFMLLDKMDRQNFEAASLALQSLAKHHAISRAFIQKSNGAEEFFRRFPNLNYESFLLDDFRNTFGPGIENGITSNISLVEKLLKGNQAADALEMFNGCKGKAYDLLIAPLTRLPEDEKMLVLNHGDYWNNNMMFKKDKDSGKFVDHILVDFQVLRYGTPSTDISYLLFTSVKSDIRRTRFKELLQVYLDTLNIISNDLGCPFDLTYDELFMDFRRKFEYGFWINVMMGNGIGFAVMKDINPEEFTDLEESVANFNALVDKWIDEHQDEACLFAEDILDLVKEYHELKL